MEFSCFSRIQVFLKYDEVEIGGDLLQQSVVPVADNENTTTYKLKYQQAHTLLTQFPNAMLLKLPGSHPL